MSHAMNSAGRLLGALGREKDPHLGGLFPTGAIGVRGFGGTPWTVELGMERHAFMRHIQLELERFKIECEEYLDDDLLEAMKVAFAALDATCYQASLQSPPIINKAVESYVVLASKKIPVESEIDEGILSGLRADIDKLSEAIESLNSSELNAEFDKILAIARDALEYYAVNGANGLEEAVHRIMAKMYKLHESNLREELESSTAWSASMGLIANLDKAVGMALKAKAIANVVREIAGWLFSG